MPTKNIEYGSGTITIGDQKFVGAIKDFTYDEEEALDRVTTYVKDCSSAFGTFTATVRISKITICKLMGLWQMALDNCPNGRVRYLMQHGSDRTKWKNYQRACKLIGRMVKEVK
jgi:hypothetical protein